MPFCGPFRTRWLQYSSSSVTLPSARLQAPDHSPGMARPGAVTTPSPPVSQWCCPLHRAHRCYRVRGRRERCVMTGPRDVGLGADAPILVAQTESGAARVDRCIRKVLTMPARASPRIGTPRDPRRYQHKPPVPTRVQVEKCARPGEMGTSARSKSTDPAHPGVAQGPTISVGSSRISE